MKTNQGIAGFRTALGAFQTRPPGAEVAAVYYAGHGIEVNGRNWLIPTDAALENDGQLAFQAIDTDLSVQAAAGARTRIVVLDAFRENPFAGRMRRTGRLTRDASPGLGAPIGEGARGTPLRAFWGMDASVSPTMRPSGLCAASHSDGKPGSSPDLSAAANAPP